MTTSIIQAVASIIAYLASIGLDMIVGKWVAYLVIAFEEKASAKAKESFSKTIEEIKKDMPKKAEAWNEWRNRIKNS